MTLPLALVVTHFFADFVLQNDWMALNKSKRWWPLTAHVLVYATPFLWWGWRFALVTFVLHWLTDAVTSRVNVRLLVAGRLTYRMDPPDTDLVFQSYHWFFVGIGTDQLLHYVALAYTLEWVS